jgi:2-oxoglutarate dehydrogenase complex dehydrogenase (E1) component-like enzyme
MRRLALSFPFSKFYHPCKFALNAETLDLATCSLANYVKLYRAYGHYYTKLDPLGLYNK